MVGVDSLNCFSIRLLVYFMSLFHQLILITVFLPGVGVLPLGFDGFLLITRGGFGTDFIVLATSEARLSSELLGHCITICFKPCDVNLLLKFFLIPFFLITNLDFF